MRSSPTSGPPPGDDDPLRTLVGRGTDFGRTILEADVRDFARVTGDMAPHHVDAAYAARTPLGRLIAHGVLLLGYASAASAELLVDLPEQVVSLGYDHVRFIRPAFVGEPVTVHYEVTAFDAVKRRTSANVEVRDRNGELLAVATHLMQASAK